jgi:hypothetical protein
MGGLTRMSRRAMGLTGKDGRSSCTEDRPLPEPASRSVDGGSLRPKMSENSGGAIEDEIQASINARYAAAGAEILQVRSRPGVMATPRSCARTASATLCWHQRIDRGALLADLIQEWQAHFIREIPQGRLDQGAW